MKDDTAPVLNALPDMMVDVQCQNLPLAEPNVTATDNCDNDVTVVYVETDNRGDGEICGTITREWTATDDCGNSTSFTQTITVVDEEAPVINCPVDLNLECELDEIPDAMTTLQGVSASDNCTPVEDIVIELDGEDQVDCGDGVYVITRTYKATDACGNSSTCTQLITVDTNIEIPCFNLRLSVSDNGGTTCYTWIVESNDPSCNALSYIEFQIPEGTTALSPEDGANYSYPGNSNNYTVINPDHGKNDGLYGIKFEVKGKTEQNLTGEVFEYCLSGPPMESITVNVKAGRVVYDVDVNVSACSFCSTDVAVKPATTFDTEVTTTSTLDAFPVPFRTDLNVRVNVDYSSKATVQMFDLAGRLVVSSPVQQVVPGSNVLTLQNIDALPQTLYIVKVQTDREELMTKVMSSSR